MPKMYRIIALRAVLDPTVGRIENGQHGRRLCAIYDFARARKEPSITPVPHGHANEYKFAFECFKNADALEAKLTVAPIRIANGETGGTRR
jgi:hypothetical protein